MITIDPAKKLDIQIASLSKEYERRKSALLLRMQTVDLADGASIAAKKAAIQAEFEELTSTYNADLDALIFGV